MKVRTSALKRDDKIRVVTGRRIFITAGGIDMMGTEFSPARNVRDSVEATVRFVDHRPGSVPGRPYQVTVLVSDGQYSRGWFPGFQTHLLSKDATP